ncbi:MAG: hypothetical protein EP330_09475 [Deltaproteobacteria bacterium]|nr:MAG: hypothetical protein EP330_09475 [Deltaproteobacteria bacterium]
MLVTGVRVAGLRDADGFVKTDLESRVELPAGPEGVAVADALELFAAGLDATRIRPMLARLGIAHGEIEIVEEDGLPVQASWDHGIGVRALLAGDAARRLTVWVEVAPDPPLFGQLRELAVREPRLVAALGNSPRLGIKVGWLFTKDLTTASIAVLELKVGDLAFPASGPERPKWAPRMLRELGTRFCRIERKPEPELAARLLAASLSPDPDERDNFRRAASALADKPFNLGALELVQVEDEIWPCFGPHLRRSRQYGPAAEEALRLVDAAFLVAPDVLIVEAAGALQNDPSEVVEWLVGRTEGNNATLEQVFLVPGGAA